ncbi:hypothetical protein, partial [Escherichia coli]|uniref:hypothetical protein n=1 Tax=Escherichia coli TaxID=562 RepID=UPI001BDB7709
MSSCNTSARLRCRAFACSPFSVSILMSGVKLPGWYTVWIRVVPVCTVVSLSPSHPYQVSSGLRDSDIH